MNRRTVRWDWVYVGFTGLLVVVMAVLAAKVVVAVPYVGWWWVAAFLVLSVVADLNPVVDLGFGGEQVEVTVSLALTFSVACIWGPLTAMSIVAAQTVFSDLVTRKDIEKIAFNAFLYVVVIGGTSLVYHLVGDPTAPYLGTANLKALVLAAGYYVVSDYLLLSGLFAVLSRRPFGKVFVGFFRDSWLNIAALLPLGMAVTGLFRLNPATILFLLPTFFLLYVSLKREQTLRSQTQTILEKLVDVLESKSPETAQHSKRVRAWVEGMCHELGMESSEADMVLQAAVLHDLGKVGLDDGLLRKPGISAEEFHHIMEHPGVSAALLEGLTLFQGGRDIVLHHHERYDGKGYPDHLVGENIPLGARIIAVADSFDAMVSMRPYRAKSLTVREALKILDDERGAQFDPELVVAFTKLVRARLEAGDMKNFPSSVRLDSTEEVSVPEGVQA
ncbi:MAG: HD domain-containing protein [Caldiserica bacterium]|nr:HD domain-containing protein [Caldisericota bacterium]